MFQLEILNQNEANIDATDTAVGPPCQYTRLVESKMRTRFIRTHLFQNKLYFFYTWIELDRPNPLLGYKLRVCLDLELSKVDIQV